MAEEKQKEEVYSIEDVLQILNIKQDDKLYYIKNFSKEKKMTLKEWSKKTGLTF